MPTIYFVVKGRALFLALLKLAFFARQTSQTAFINYILSVFDRSFSISLKTFNLCSLKSAALKAMRFWLAVFWQNDAKSLESWPSSTPTSFVFQEASIIISSNQNLSFLFRFTRNSESILFAVNIAYFLFQIVHIFRFIAGSCYPSSVATESALYSVSDEWLVQRNGRRSSLSKYKILDSKSVSMFSRWPWVLRESQLYRIPSS